MIYKPQQPPQDPKQLSAWLMQEHQRIAEALSIAVDSVLLAPSERAPTKPRDGQVVFTTGTNWNPGSGGGYYGYRSGAWRFLG